MGIDPLAQKLRSIKDNFEAELESNLKPIPDSWEDFVSLCTIRSGGKMMRFQPYPYQLLLSRLMDEHNNIIVTKSRQLGITQCVSSTGLAYHLPIAQWHSYAAKRMRRLWREGLVKCWVD